MGTRRQLSTSAPLNWLVRQYNVDARQALVALTVSATTSLITGLTLASITGSLERHPGLLLLIPAAVGLRGNVFGPLGGRLSTSLRTGTFQWSSRVDSLLGQNVVAALVSSFVAAIGIALVAGLVADVVAQTTTLAIGLSDFIVVSVLGGLLASIVVLAITLALTVASDRFGWDLDNVTAPVVSSAGDFVTLPALVACTTLIGRGNLTVILAGILVVVGLVAMAVVLRSPLRTACSIIRESLPILIGAGCLSLFAGVALEHSLERLVTYGVLLVVLPGFLTTGGALGGILSSRLATKFHLGLIERTWRPDSDAASDIVMTFSLAAPVYLTLALLGQVGAAVSGAASPGALRVVVVVLTAALATTAIVVSVAYYATLQVVRFGLDPDNFGIPLVSASLDIVGAFALLGAVALWGVA